MMIVEDTIAIGRRLAELQQRSKSKFPDNVRIVRANRNVPTRFSSQHDIIFMLHEGQQPKLVIVHISNPGAARDKLMDFVKFMEERYPSVRAAHGEVTLSQSDCAALIEEIGI